MDSKRTNHKLTMLVQHKLNNYVIENYSSSGKTDAEFAVQAEQVLGTKITSNNVQGVRNAFDIPANINPTGSGSSAQHRALEARVARLELNMKVLIAFAQQLTAEKGLKFDIGQFK